MRSSLSRNVCRRLLASHGPHGSLPPASTVYDQHHVLCIRSIRPSRALIRHPQRRTFLGLWKRPPREVKDAGFEPGFGTFLDFRAHTLDNVKPPSREELVQAFRIFFDYKTTRKKPLNVTQAFAARLVLEHLQAERSEEPTLTSDDLKKALDATDIPPRLDSSEDHVSFAKVLYKELRALQHGSDKKQRSYKVLLAELNSKELDRFIAVLTRCGAADDAAKYLVKFDNIVSRANTIGPGKLSALHMDVLRGYANGRNHQGLGGSGEAWDHRAMDYAEKLLKAGFVYTYDFHEIMTSYLAARGSDGQEELRSWFRKPIAGHRMAKPEAYLALAKYSARTGRKPEWLRKALQDLCDMNPPKPWWDVVLKWALIQGKDIDHIKHMIDVIAKLNQKDESVRADTYTINGLLATALETKNALLAERVNRLTSELGLRPSARTYALLLQARILGQDDVGAASIFDELIHCGTIYPGSKVHEAINEYIRYLCSGTSSDTVDIVAVLSHVERRHGELDPETVVALCQKFLKEDKTMDLIDTLGLHLKQFSMDDRELVRTALAKYCLDETVSTARAWDCYSLLRQFFPELGKQQREELMEGFFNRKRADMACHIFGHMRAHPDERFRPELDTYVACLEGLGAYPDEESLSMIHNMFKMDSMIQPNTRLLNAFMIAYTGCDGPRRAFDFWQQISHSVDGPTYRSLELVFRVCQKLPFGYDRAKVIWQKMQKLEVEVPAATYDAYTLMAAGQGRLDKVQSLLLSRLTEYGAEPHPLQ